MSAVRRACTVSGCASSSIGPGCARGYCSKHYKRWRRHGDPTAGRTPDGEPLAYLHQQLLVETDECLKWPYAGGGSEYGRITIDGANRPVHRYVCELLCGPCPDGMEAAHYCGVRRCFNPRHVRWATPKENQADRLIHGTHGRGTQSPSAKLTDEQVIFIRTLRGTETAAAVARRFGVCEGSIFDIWNRRTWAWL